MCRAVFGLGSYLGARPSVDPSQELAVLRAEIDLLRKRQELAPTGTAGIAPPPPVVKAPVFDNEKRAAIVTDVKRQLQTEMGLLPLTLIRDRRHSFVELHSYDDRGDSSYGTAGYLGNGYFITVKHAVVALGDEGASNPRVINSITLMIDGRPVSARVVDVGDARVEVARRLGDPRGQGGHRSPGIECRAELSVRVCRSDLPSGQ